MMDLKGIACRGILKDLTDLQHHIDVTPYAEQNIYQAGVHDPVYAGKNQIAHIKKHHPHVIKVCAAREAGWAGRMRSVWAAPPRAVQQGSVRASSL